MRALVACGGWPSGSACERGPAAQHAPPRLDGVGRVTGAGWSELAYLLALGKQQLQVAYCDEASSSLQGLGCGERPTQWSGRGVCG